MRVLPGGQGIIEKILSVFGHFEMDAGECGNFIFYFLLTQQIQDMVVDVNGGGNVVVKKYSGETVRLSKRLRHSTATKVPCGENIF